MERAHLVSDLLSDLPENLIEKILSHLPLRDAVRTSVLAKKWMHRWTSIPRLEFRDGMFPNRYPPLTANQILLIIHQVLLLHRGPITKFVLSVLRLESGPEINHLINFLATKGAEDVSVYMLAGKHHKLPPYLFSRMQLRNLRLQHCLFEPPLSFREFSRLTCIGFFDVMLPANFTKSFVSKLPLLEQLTLHRCTNVDFLDFINAPNLKNFEFLGTFKSLSLENISTLAEVILLTDKVNWQGDPVSSLSLDSLPCLMHLYIDKFSKLMMTWGPNSLDSLVFLELYGVSLGLYQCAACILPLVKCSLVLQKLKIKLHRNSSDDPKAAEQLLEAEASSEFSRNQLQEVHVIEFLGTKCEMLFIKLLLDHSPMLQTLQFHLNPSVKNSEQIKVLEGIVRFSRASPRAEIMQLLSLTRIGLNIADRITRLPLVSSTRLGLVETAECVVCLLERSPNLQKLLILQEPESTYDPQSAIQFSEARDSFEFFVGKLEVLR